MEQAIFQFWALLENFDLFFVFLLFFEFFEFLIFLGNFIKIIDNFLKNIGSIHTSFIFRGGCAAPVAIPIGKTIVRASPTTQFHPNEGADL